MELLTVLLLTYNHENSLPKAIESILEQKTNFDFVIHVLEDCSTDKTPGICKEYKAKYPDKIELFLNPKNLGVAGNLKQGIMRVKSKYYAFLEGDDYWCHPQKLQLQVDILEQNPDCVICGHNTLFKDLVKHKEWLLVNEPENRLKTKYDIRDKFGVHPSSRVYRNIIDYTDLPSYMVFDTYSALIYMTKGNLYYINQTLSVYNITGGGFWAGKKRKEKRLMALKLRYQANKYFDFAYDYKYYQNSKLLKYLKVLFGVKMGWFFFYHLERWRVHLKFLFS